ncbi:uncharacterized protein KY384_008116 [Bacidia gigantensis]|uniref:uncharacterized protein n=1 Tax=Bacidia gigantensis TaxID=2732470 RepID=UPI001D03ACBB|nr:uncharacterized protein KY384_008116 [Bacidia gigantensis]KAG8526687.1 hypothetical protein KY384_008116 [Bacidia gigantensis]
MPAHGLFVKRAVLDTLLPYSYTRQRQNLEPLLPGKGHMRGGIVREAADTKSEEAGNEEEEKYERENECEERMPIVDSRADCEDSDGSERKRKDAEKRTDIDARI